MGGAGGLFHGSDKPEELFRKVRESESKTGDQTFETEVGGYIGSLLAKYNERSEIVREHLETIKKALEKEIDGTVDLLFGGSVARHTYVDGISDVDALVVLNKSELVDKSPEEVKGYFLNRLNVQLPNTLIEEGTLAVTVKYTDIEIQLLPALRSKEGFRIADSSGRGWSIIKPLKFAERLTRANQEMGGKLIPTIKLAKSIISALPKSRQLEGYHTESLAIRIFQDYDGPKSPKAMLTHFFCNAGQHIKNPIKDVTGQSIYLDSYLGEADSINRKVVGDSLTRIGRRMKNGDGARSLRQWQEILGGL